MRMSSLYALTLAVMRREAVIDFIDGLRPRERLILALRFGLLDDQERNNSQIGRAIGLSRESIRKIAARTMADLEARRDIAHLKEWVE